MPLHVQTIRMSTHIIFCSPSYRVWYETGKTLVEVMQFSLHKQEQFGSTADFVSQLPAELTSKNPGYQQYMNFIWFPA